MNFLITDVIQFSSDTKITFSQGGAAKIESKQFSEFGYFRIGQKLPKLESKTLICKQNSYMTQLAKFEPRPSGMVFFINNNSLPHYTG